MLHSLAAFRDMLNKSDKSEGAYAVRTAKTLIKITNKVSDDTDSVDGYQPTILGKKSKSEIGRASCRERV